MRKFKRGAKKFKKNPNQRSRKFLELLQEYERQNEYENVLEYFLKHGWDFTLPEDNTQVD